MIDCDYYKDYVGPNLVRATLNNNEDFTEKVRGLYGESCNWNCKLYTYKEVFGNECQGKYFRIDFKKDDHDHWFHGYISNIDEYMNPPLATPINEK